MNRDGFERRTIGVSTTRGTLRRVASVRGDFAVHRAIENRGRYVVTHLPTGARVTGLSFATEAAARGAAMDLQSMSGNWVVTTGEATGVDFDAVLEVFVRHGGQQYLDPAADTKRPPGAPLINGYGNRRH